MNEEVRTQLIRARIALYVEQPLYGILAMRLVFEEAPIKTLSVDGITIRYNPEFVATLSHGLTMSAIAHEILHVMLDHIERGADLNRGKWNAAADYVVNNFLKIDKFQLGEDWLYNAAYDGMTAQHVYALLPDNPNGPADPDPHGWGSLDEIDTSTLTEAQKEEVAIDWKIAVIGAARIAEERGELPNSMKRLVEEVRGNKVSWRERLRRFAVVNSKTGVSWTRPLRRMLPHGFYLPSRFSQVMGLMITGIDTSGSIDDAVLNAFGAEIIAARNAVNPKELVNVYCDAKVQKVDRFGAHDNVTFEAKGGGGTKFAPVFDWVTENNIEPACLIYLTDGYGTWPTVIPPYPVLWVITTEVIAPFGETVRIEI